jgi:hypothetical protein
MTEYGFDTYSSTTQQWKITKPMQRYSIKTREAQEQKISVDE